MQPASDTRTAAQMLPGEGRQRAIYSFTTDIDSAEQLRGGHRTHGVVEYHDE